jgi:hypothetical protein
VTLLHVGKNYKTFLHDIRILSDAAYTQSVDETEQLKKQNSQLFALVYNIKFFIIINVVMMI